MSITAVPCSGLPLRSIGRKVQCRTDSTAAGTSVSGPVTGWTNSTRPSGSTIATTRTEPCRVPRYFGGVRRTGSGKASECVTSPRENAGVDLRLLRLGLELPLPHVIHGRFAQRFRTGNRLGLFDGAIARDADLQDHLTFHPRVQRLGRVHDRRSVHHRWATLIADGHHAGSGKYIRRLGRPRRHIEHHDVDQRQHDGLRQPPRGHVHRRDRATEMPRISRPFTRETAQ